MIEKHEVEINCTVACRSHRDFVYFLSVLSWDKYERHMWEIC